MNKREFLEKFVVLSLASLILSGCMAKEESVIYDNNENVRFKDIISDSNGESRPNNNGFQPIIQKR